MDTMPAMAASDSGAGVVIVAVLIYCVIVLAAIGAYLVPTIIAALRHVPNVGSVVVINVLLGWTFVGWVVALAMAMRSATAQPSVVNVYNGLPGQGQSATTTGGQFSAVPGWYPDPSRQSRFRYFDGVRWTDFTKDDG